MATIPLKSGGKPFNPQVNNYDSQVSYRVNESRFGDGYAHIAPAGLNNKQEKLSLSFVGLSNSDKDILCNFFDSLQGVTSFQFTKPGESTAYNYKCKGYSQKSIGGLKWTVDCTIERYYQ